jgi:hypothetical protein
MSSAWFGNETANGMLALNRPTLILNVLPYRLGSQLEPAEH